MRKTREILDSSPLACYQSSKVARIHLESQIKRRFGAQALKDYRIDELLTFSQWSARGYKIKPWERAVWTIVHRRTIDEHGRVIRCVRDRLAVFLPCQVHKVIY